MADILFRAARGRACPCCSLETRGCSSLADGAVWCRGTPGPDWRIVHTGDTWLTCRRVDDRPAGRRRDRATSAAPKGASAPAAREPAAPAGDWARRAAGYAREMTDRDRAIIAARLGLPVEALAAVPLLGIAGRRSGAGASITYAIPECDADGAIIGLATRVEYTRPRGRASAPRADKLALTGSRRGLTMPAAMIDRARASGVLYCVEGASDTLAVHHAGLAVVGRPSADGGAEMLAALMRRIGGDVRLCVVCEHDGTGGALGEKLAARVSEMIGATVAYCYPPDGAKDSRAWLTADDPGRAALEWHECGALLDAHFRATAVEVKPSPKVDSSKDFPIFEDDECARSSGVSAPPLDERTHATPDDDATSSAPVLTSTPAPASVPPDPPLVTTCRVPTTRYRGGLGPFRDDRKFRVASCRLWTCPACGPALRAHWCAIGTGCISRAKTVGLFTGTASQFRALKLRLQRAKKKPVTKAERAKLLRERAAFLAAGKLGGVKDIDAKLKPAVVEFLGVILEGSKRLFVVIDPPPGFAELSYVDRDDAAKRWETSVMALKARRGTRKNPFRPVTRSAGLIPPKTKRAATEVDKGRVGRETRDVDDTTPHDPAEVARETARNLRDAGVVPFNCDFATTDVSALGTRVSLEWRWPYHWPEEHKRRCDAAVRRCEPLPPLVPTDYDGEPDAMDKAASRLAEIAALLEDHDAARVKADTAEVRRRGEVRFAQMTIDIWLAHLADLRKGARRA